MTRLRYRWASINRRAANTARTERQGVLFVSCTRVHPLCSLSPHSSPRGTEGYFCHWPGPEGSRVSAVSLARGPLIFASSCHPYRRSVCASRFLPHAGGFPGEYIRDCPFSANQITRAKASSSAAACSLLPFANFAFVRATPAAWCLSRRLQRYHVMLFPKGT